jgi:hypothetical protein
MSDSKAETGEAADPLGQWRELRDAYMETWSKAMGEAVNSEAYAQSSGVMLETCLSVSTPILDAQKKAMSGALEQLNMPSQADFVSLAGRLTNIELLLDDMAAKLDQILKVATETKAEKPGPEATKSAKTAAGN